MKAMAMLVKKIDADLDSDGSDKIFFASDNDKLLSVVSQLCGSSAHVHFEGRYTKGIRLL